jgi:folate-binding protein YgfZ
MHEQAGASLAHYGPSEAGVLLVEAFGELELEYAALRKSCVLLDRPDRGVLRITGADRLDFLNRMVTQELKGLGERNEGSKGGQRIGRTFWLNRKGRIDADMTLIAHGDAILAELDVHALDRAAKGLGAFIITEDVTLADATEETHRFSLHGPGAFALLRASTATALDVATDCSMAVNIDGHEVIVFRDDSAGEIGLELIVPAKAAASIYGRLRDAGEARASASHAPKIGEAGGGFVADDRSRDGRPRVRLSGWHAYNIARIEAGRALYNLDFGADSLPHETGDETLADRVSFKKGCYLGQEVVARMHSRGHPKQKLVAIRCESRLGLLTGEGLSPQALLPVTGANIHASGGDEKSPAIGAVTSSTLSPMLSQRPICFAMMKWEFAAAGTRVSIDAEGERIEGAVQESLRFWKKDRSADERSPAGAPAHHDDLTRERHANEGE